jgi:Bacteriocin-protection, YdeI or OmpD-Associated
MDEPRLTELKDRLCSLLCELDYRHEALYCDPVSSPLVPGGVVHKLPADLRKSLIANPTALDAWKDITPLARNEFICWVEDAKQEITRERRIRRTQEELEEGMRRPCCWPGCKHRERTGR